MSDVAKIENSIFTSLSSTGKGGAISNEANQEIVILNCAFYNVSANNVGGAIFKEKGSLLLQKCAFCLCKTTLQQNNNGGNTLKALSCNLNGTYISAYMSWHSEASGDSCVHTSECGLYFKHGNVSHCAHLRSYSSVFVEGISSTEETVSYFGCYESDSYRCLYFSAASGKYNNDHIIIASVKVNRLIEAVNNGKVEDSCFYNNTFSSLFYNIVASNCIGDLSYTGIAQTSQDCPTIEIFKIEKLSKNMIKCTKIKRKHFIIKNIILLFILYAY